MEERLLLFHEGLQSPLGGFLRLEELFVQRRGLFLHPLQRGKALLRDLERLREAVGIRIGHSCHLGETEIALDTVGLR
jgi:hypothetical protein